MNTTKRYALRASFYTIAVLLLIANFEILNIQSAPGGGANIFSFSEWGGWGKSGHAYSLVAVESTHAYANKKFGWYPTDSYTLSKGEIKDDSQRNPNGQGVANCTPSTAIGAANRLKTYHDSDYYMLVHNNCVQVAKDIFKRAYGAIPETKCEWMGVYVECPGSYTNWLLQTFP